MVEWTSGGFDPEAFDPGDINWALQLTEDDPRVSLPTGVAPSLPAPSDEPDEVKLAPAYRFARYVRAIAAAGSLAPPGENVQTAIPCRRRPKHRRCPGYLTIRRSDAPPEIDYQCLACGQERGTIYGWKDTIADLSRAGSTRLAKQHEFFLSPEDYETLRGLSLLDPESERIVYGARPSDRGMRLLASIEDLGVLQQCLMLAARDEPNQSHRRPFVRLFAILAGVLGPETR
jgi:hypothetical protein